MGNSSLYLRSRATGWGSRRGTGESGRRRTRFRSEGERGSGGKTNSLCIHRNGVRLGAECFPQVSRREVRSSAGQFAGIELRSQIRRPGRPVEDWGKLLGDTAAVTAMLDRLLLHGHVLKCGPRSWRTKNKLAAKGFGGVKQLCPGLARWPVLT